METHRRGVATAGTVVAVTAGSAWLQGLIDAQRPDALRIRDFPHAVEHRTAADWVAAQAHTLKHGAPTLVLLALLDLPVRAARWDAIQYATFLAAGYPIGDGAIARANKRLPEARLKGSGMRWARANVTPLLALRTVAANDRGDAAWPQLRAHRHTLPAAPAPPPPPRTPRRTGAIPALPPERARRPHPWSYLARLNAHSLPDTRAIF